MPLVYCLLWVICLLVNSWRSPDGKGRAAEKSFIWSIELNSFFFFSPPLETVFFGELHDYFLSFFLWFPSQIRVKFSSKLLAELIPSLQSHTMVSSLKKAQQPWGGWETSAADSGSDPERLCANSCWDIYLGFLAAPGQSNNLVASKLSCSLQV